MTFNDQPLCDGLLSRDHKAKLEMSLDYLVRGGIGGGYRLADIDLYIKSGSGYVPLTVDRKTRKTK